MKIFHFAVTEKHGDKFVAYRMEATHADNLLAIFNYSLLAHVNLCETKKQADQVVAYWNQCYKKNGTYLYA